MDLRTDRKRRPIACLAVPGCVSTATAVAVRLVLPDAGPALVLAALSGLLTLGALLALAYAEHRAEILRAGAESYALRKVTDAAVCGRTDTVGRRRDARAYAAELGLSGLFELAGRR
jgi:hypothetical protein